MMDVQRVVVMQVVAVIGSACLLVFSTDDEEDETQLFLNSLTLGSIDNKQMWHPLYQDLSSVICNLFQRKKTKIA
jgi:hypothetical protein